MLSFGVEDFPKDAVCQFEVKQADAFIDKPTQQEVDHQPLAGDQPQSATALLPQLGVIPDLIGDPLVPEFSEIGMALEVGRELQ